MRKRELSLLNVLFCLLVIFIHIVSYPLAGYTQGSIPYNGVLVLWRLASFVVQGFILLAGLKLFLGREKPYFVMLKSKLKTIILPYTIWYVVYFIFYVIIADYPLDISFIAKHFFLGSLAPHTYFIPLIMQFFLLYPLWKLIIKSINPFLAVSLAFLISTFAESILPVILYKNNLSFLYNDRLFTTYISYWIVGCYLGANYERFSEFIHKHSFIIPYVFTVIINILFTYINYNIKYISYLNIIHSVYCFITILFLFRVFSRIKEKSNLITNIDKSSYTIYLCHMLFVFISSYLFQNIICIQSNILLFLLMVITVYPASIITSIFINKLKK